MVYIKIYIFPVFVGGTKEKHGTTPYKLPIGLKFTQLPGVRHTEGFRFKNGNK